MVPGGEGRGRRTAAEPFDPAGHVVPVPADDRQVQHGDLHLGRVPADRNAMPVQDVDLVP